jgi:hypothetical protein
MAKTSSRPRDPAATEMEYTIDRLLRDPRAVSANPNDPLQLVLLLCRRQCLLTLAEVPLG